MRPRPIARRARALGRLACLALLGIVPSGGARAQVVAGKLRDAASRAPVEGALILLLDASGQRVGGTLTDGNGSFGIVAPGAGRYVVRAERIGYETLDSDALSLAPHEVRSMEVLVAAMAVSLEGLEVRGTKRCGVRPDDGAALSRVWGEAQKALRNQAWTDEAGWVRFRLRRYEREYDAGMRVVVSQRRTFDGWTHGNPIRSLPADDLLQRGFVRPTDDGGWEYFGPDAGVLLSDAFLETHCFELAVDERSPELIGLAFEPIRGRRVPDISGTFWLTRADARLRSLQFVYTSAPWAEAAKVASGRVEFDELEGGPWVVRKWWIRMPRMERDMGLARGGRSGLRVAGIVEVGGTATPVDVTRTSAAVPELGAIAGAAWDSTRGRPLAGATVLTADGARAATTDSAGRFVLRDVPVGVVELALRHPRVDSLPMAPAPLPVRVIAGDTARVWLGVPSRVGMLAIACGATEREEGEAVVLGRVTDARTEETVAGATVTLEWSEYRVIAGGEVKRDIRGLRVTTDERGRYTACGIPPGVRLDVRASLAEADGPLRTIAVPRDGVVALHLTLRR